jgi:sec-independent protein translocase protein TatA
MFKNIGLPELAIIILVLILLFGSKKIKELARQTGEAGRELKRVKNEYKETVAEIKKESAPARSIESSKNKETANN